MQRNQEQGSWEAGFSEFSEKESEKYLSVAWFRR